jgi:hypothetical protein
VCDGYTDLGVKCTSARGMQDGAAARAVGGRRAMHAALSMSKRAKLTQPAFKLRVFDALDEPVLSYGCQVWGPWAWNIREPLGSPAEKVHMDLSAVSSSDRALQYMGKVGLTRKWCGHSCWPMYHDVNNNNDKKEASSNSVCGHASAVTTTLNTSQPSP